MRCFAWFGTICTILKTWKTKTPAQNAAKCLGYSLYCFWVIKRKPTEGEGERDRERLGLSRF